MGDRIYLYSHGRRRHIAVPGVPGDRYRPALCGDRYMTDAEMSERGDTGYQPARARRFPICVRCAKAADQSAPGSDREEPTP